MNPPKALLEMSEREWEKHRANDYRQSTRPDGNRCPLVNPLCPNDLCVLPANHPGTSAGWHVLGTDPYDHPFRYVRGKRSVFFMHPDGAGVSDDELIELGWEKQRELEKDKT